MSSARFPDDPLRALGELPGDDADVLGWEDGEDTLDFAAATYPQAAPLVASHGLAEQRVASPAASGLATAVTSRLLLDEALNDAVPDATSSPEYESSSPARPIDPATRPEPPGIPAPAGVDGDRSLSSTSFSTSDDAEAIEGRRSLGFDTSPATNRGVDAPSKAKRGFATNVAQFFTGKHRGCENDNNGAVTRTTGGGDGGVGSPAETGTLRDPPTGLEALPGLASAVALDAREELWAQCEAVASIKAAMEAGKRSCDALAGFLKGLAAAEAAYARALSRLPSPVCIGHTTALQSSDASRATRAEDAAATTRPREEEEENKREGASDGIRTNDALSNAAAFPRSAAAAHGDLGALLAEEAARVLTVGADCLAAGRAADELWRPRRRACESAAAAFSAAAACNAKQSARAADRSGGSEELGGGVKDDPWVSEANVLRRRAVLRDAQTAARAAIAEALARAKAVDARRVDTLASVASGYVLAHEALMQRETARLSVLVSTTQTRVDTADALDARRMESVAQEAALSGALHGRRTASSDRLDAEDLLRSPEIRRQGAMDRLVGSNPGGGVASGVGGEASVGSWEPGLAVLTRAGYLHWVPSTPALPSSSPLDALLDVAEPGVRLACCRLGVTMIDQYEHGDRADHAIVVREMDASEGDGGRGGGGFAAGWKQLVGARRERRPPREFVLRAPSEQLYVEWAVCVKEAIAEASATRDAAK